MTETRQLLCTRLRLYEGLQEEQKPEEESSLLQAFRLHVEFVQEAMDCARACCPRLLDVLKEDKKRNAFKLWGAPRKSPEVEAATLEMALLLDLELGRGV